MVKQRGVLNRFEPALGVIPTTSFVGSTVVWVTPGTGTGTGTGHLCAVPIEM